MGKIYIIAIVLCLIGCSSKKPKNEIDKFETNGTLNKKENSQKRILVVEIDGAWVREYPSDGEVIMKLKNGTECEVLKKGKKEAIKGKTDFWYKIKYIDKEGWIFGSQTSLKLEQKIYSIPQELKIDQDLKYGMCEGEYKCLVEEFFPIGWSDSGYFAFIVQPENEVIGGYDLTFVIQNMVDDKIEWKWFYKEYRKEDWDEKTRDDIVTVWNNNKNLFFEKLNEYGIIQFQENFSLNEFPLKINGKTYTVRIEKTEDNKSMFGGKIGSEIVFFNGEGLGSKILHDVEYDETNTLVNSMILGAIPNPKKDRIAIIKVNENMGWEGPPNILSVELIGSHLTSGFKKNLSQKVDNWSGEYESPFNAGDISFGFLSIKQIKNKKYNFEIKTGHLKGCTGELSGDIEIEKNGIGIYSTKTCKKLKFQFQKQMVKIEEKDCDYHGMRCAFTGEYILKK